MKILLTGATGLVGKEIVRQALKLGYEIHFLTTRRDKKCFFKGVKGFYWNPKNREIELECFDNVQSIIHLSGATISKRWTKQYKKKILDSRISSTQFLYDSLEKIGSERTVQQVVSASAIGIYPSSLSQTYTENWKGEPTSFLGKVVQKWEEEINRFSTLGIKTTIIRLGLVLDKKEGAFPQILKPIYFGLGTLFGSGKQKQSWIHVEDLARLFLCAEEHNWIGVFNGVAPEIITQKEIIDYLAQSVQYPILKVRIPSLALSLLLGEMSDLLLISSSVSSNKVIEKGFVFNYLVLKKAIEDLM